MEGLDFSVLRNLIYMFLLRFEKMNTDLPYFENS